MSIIVYGARCTWWDAIERVALRPSGLPCCPKCEGPLFQQKERDWWAGVDRYEAEGNPGYGEMLEWIRGRCFTLAPGERAIDRIAEEYAKR